MGCLVVNATYDVDLLYSLINHTRYNKPIPVMKTELQVTRDKLNDISKIIVGAALEVHRHMGPGLLESIYQHCMVEELRSMGILCRSKGARYAAL